MPRDVQVLEDGRSAQAVSIEPPVVEKIEDTVGAYPDQAAGDGGIARDVAEREVEDRSERQLGKEALTAQRGRTTEAERHQVPNAARSP
jgi:hypothetical protein